MEIIKNEDIMMHMFSFFNYNSLYYLQHVNKDFLDKIIKYTSINKIILFQPFPASYYNPQYQFKRLKLTKSKFNNLMDVC